MNANDPQSSPVTEALDAQGVLEPGAEGWWKVWGASARDIQAGDLIMARWTNKDDSTFITEHEVVTVESQPPTAKVTDANGKVFRVGWLQPVIVLRRGTHNTLAR